jgi:lysozyme
MTTEVLTTGIVDAHHADGTYDLAAFKAGGGVALIYKATEGGDFRDKGFAKAMDACKVAGILRGAYHFANGATDPVVQADNFLAAVAPYPNTLLVLDLETAPKGSKFGTMSLAQGVAFILRVHEKTGRWCVFYSYKSLLGSMLAKATAEEKAVLARCPLWEAAYGPDPMKTKPPAPWPRWDLFQYTDHAAGPTDRVKYPRGVPGFKRAAQDRSCFVGTPDDLAVWWKTAGFEGGVVP